jgi:hypothetical protein
MESCFKVVEEKIAATIKLLDNHGAWWYSLFGDEDDDSSLCNLLKVDYSTLLKIYGHCGLLRTLSVGNQPAFNKLGLSTFKTNHNIDLEYDTFNKRHFVRIGSFSKSTGKFLCKSQLKQGLLTKPRIGTALRRQILKLVVDIKGLIGGGPDDAAINQATSNLLSSPPARLLPPPATPATAPPHKPRKTLPSAISRIYCTAGWLSSCSLMDNLFNGGMN